MINLNNWGLNQEDLLENSKLLCFKGNFRRMIIKPDYIEFKMIKHSNKKEELQTGYYTIG